MKKEPSKKQKSQVARVKRRQAQEKSKGRKPFGEEIRAELSRVTWPNQETVVKASVLILIIVCLSTLFIAGVDVVFAKAFDWLNARVG